MSLKTMLPSLIFVSVSLKRKSPRLSSGQRQGRKEVSKVPRYWLNFGVKGESFGEKPRKTEIPCKLLEIPGMELGEGGEVVFKSTGLEEVKKVAEQALKIIQTEYPDASKAGFSVRTQPECPECGELGRFSDSFCSQCGSKLSEAGWIDLE